MEMEQPPGPLPRHACRSDTKPIYEHILDGEQDLVGGYRKLDCLDTLLVYLVWLVHKGGTRGGAAQGDRCGDPGGAEGPRSMKDGRRLRRGWRGGRTGGRTNEQARRMLNLQLVPIWGFGQSTQIMRLRLDRLLEVRLRVRI